ncbi:hypothetical protein [Kitasatospora aureofaciens]|uniref:hypothetical protein n=1 Tax=Kitasatospora aureofaciens TaxID=1894 RepID=UPI0036F4A099
MTVIFRRQPVFAALPTGSLTMGSAASTGPEAGSRRLRFRIGAMPPLGDLAYAPDPFDQEKVNEFPCIFQG